MGNRGLMSTTLVLADDHPLILEGLESAFAKEQDLTVLARCANGVEALDAVRHLRPDILLLDLHMPGMSGIDVVRELQKDSGGSPATRVVILTSGADEREILECMHLRVPGIVLKSMPPHLVVQCVRKVADGDVWLEKDSFSRVLELLLRREEGLQHLGSALSDRETEVLTLCARGLTNGQIAARLHVVEGTVKTHLHNVYRKLGLNGRAELIEFAHQHGLVQ
jgi:DNA-binding NarL/FixJ family response regulator